MDKFDQVSIVTMKYCLSQIKNNIINRVSLKVITAEVVALRPETLLKKETLAQVFSCKFCKIFKNTFFYRTPPMATSVTSNLRRCFKSSKIYRMEIDNVRLIKNW